MRYRLLTILVLVALMFAVAGCGEEQQNQKPKAAKKTVKKQQKTIVPEVVESEEQPEKYVYNPLGKRDPFDNPLKAVVDIASETGVPLTPLQKFDLGQLRLIGVIVGKGDPRAMVIAPDGKSFILRTGTKIGKNNGTVVAISTDAVQVQEKYYDFTGEIKTSIQEIRLPKSGGVK